MECVPARWQCKRRSAMIHCLKHWDWAHSLCCRLRLKSPHFDPLERIQKTAEWGGLRFWKIWRINHLVLNCDLAHCWSVAPADVTGVVRYREIRERKSLKLPTWDVVLRSASTEFMYCEIPSTFSRAVVSFRSAIMPSASWHHLTFNLIFVRWRN